MVVNDSAQLAAGSHAPLRTQNLPHLSSRGASATRDLHRQHRSNPRPSLRADHGSARCRRQPSPPGLLRAGPSPAPRPAPHSRQCQLTPVSSWASHPAADCTPLHFVLNEKRRPGAVERDERAQRGLSPSLPGQEPHPRIGLFAGNRPVRGRSVIWIVRFICYHDGKLAHPCRRVRVARGAGVGSVAPRSLCPLS